MRTLQLFLLLAILGCFASGPVFLSARDGAEGTKAEASATDPPKLWVIRHFQVEPTKEGQFEKALGEIAKGFEQANLGPEYMWLTSRGYLSVGNYRVMYALRTFADLDRQDAWRKPVEAVLGKAKLAELEASAVAFADDRLPNVLVAQSVGITGIAVPGGTLAPRYLNNLLRALDL